MLTKTGCRLGRNTTGPPWSVGRPTTHAPGWLARQPTVLQMTMTDASEQNNTGPLGRPVINDDGVKRSTVDLVETKKGAKVYFNHFSQILFCENVSHVL